jgi:hypothetical protein
VIRWRVHFILVGKDDNCHCEPASFGGRGNLISGPRMRLLRRPLPPRNDDGRFVIASEARQSPILPVVIFSLKIHPQPCKLITNSGSAPLIRGVGWAVPTSIRGTGFSPCGR